MSIWSRCWPGYSTFVTVEYALRATNIVSHTTVVNIGEERKKKKKKGEETGGSVSQVQTQLAGCDTANTVHTVLLWSTLVGDFLQLTWKRLTRAGCSRC